MTLRLFFVLAIAFLFTSSCGDNLFYFGADKQSSAVSNSSIDIAFVQGNCEYVKQQYKSRIDNGEKLTNEMDRYRYGTAILACTGYDLVNYLSVLLDKNVGEGGGEIDMFFDLIGVNGELRLATIANYRASYTEVLNQCTDVKEDTFKLMCGFASSADTIMAVAFTALTVSGATSLPAKQAQITALLTGKTGNIGELLNNFVLGYAVRDPDFLPLLARDYDYTDAAVTVLQNITGTVKFAAMLKAINDDLVSDRPAVAFVITITNLLGLS